jgi:hypothetical protein
MDRHDRPQAAKWGIVTCGGALLVVISAYAAMILAAQGVD